MKTKPRWYRKWDLDVSRDVIEASVAKFGSDPANYAHSSLEGPYCPADSEALCGRKLVFRGEGHVFAFDFGALHCVRFSEDGGEEKIKIDAGFSNGNITEISGVSEGDTLIIKGKVS